MGETVTFKANGRQTNGYLALPPSGSGPGVVVVQEWWGLVPQITGVCDRLAAQGFVTLAPDLFHGQSTTSPDQAKKLMMALTIDEAEQDLRCAIRYVLQHEATTGQKVATVGFCMGGALSLFAAAKNPEVGACVVYYGGHPNVKPDLPRLKGPVLGLYAANDGFVTPESVRKLDEELTRLGKRHQFHSYPGTGHAFANETGASYDEAATSDAWEKTLEFLRQEL